MCPPHLKHAVCFHYKVAASSHMRLALLHRLDSQIAFNLFSIMSLLSGVYTITNARFRNLASLPNVEAMVCNIPSGAAADSVREAEKVHPIRHSNHSKLTLHSSGNWRIAITADIPSGMSALIISFKPSIDPKKVAMFSQHRGNTGGRLLKAQTGFSSTFTRAPLLISCHRLNMN